MTARRADFTVCTFFARRYFLMGLSFGLCNVLVQCSRMPNETFGNETRSMFELYSGPVNVKQADLSRIDPTLDACCQREVRN